MPGLSGLFAIRPPSDDDVAGINVEVCPANRRKLLTLGVDSPFFSTIVLFKNQMFPWVFDGLLKRRIPGQNGEGTPRHNRFNAEKHILMYRIAEKQLKKKCKNTGTTQPAESCGRPVTRIQSTECAQRYATTPFGEKATESAKSNGCGSKIGTQMDSFPSYMETNKD